MKAAQTDSTKEACNAVDISDCPSPHGFGNKVGRLAWGIVFALFFRPSPRICHGWRRFVLRLFGARIGRGAHIYPTTKIWAPWNLTMGEHSTLSFNVDCYCVVPIRIGAHATVSQYSYLCCASHDVSDPNMRLTTAPITIGDGAWICADVFVGPGVTIGAGAVVGARSSAFKDVEAGTINVGTPCRQIGRRELRASGENEKRNAHQS